MNEIKIVLSTAMREGAKLRPQSFGFFFSHAEGEVCSCALGSIWEYLHGNTHPPAINNDALCELLGIAEIVADHPIYNKVAPIGDIIASLNDDNLWSREQIADWLESLGF